MDWTYGVEGTKVVVTNPSSSGDVLEITSVIDKNQFSAFTKRFSAVLFVCDASTSEKHVRYMVEKGYCTHIAGLHLVEGKDFMHQAKTHFNHVLATLCKKNSIGVVFSVDQFVKASAQDLHRIGVILQLCKKYGVEVDIFSLSSHYSWNTVDRQSLIHALF